jgi:hypothetical protein
VLPLASPAAQQAQSARAAAALPHCPRHDRRIVSPPFLSSTRVNDKQPIYQTSSHRSNVSRSEHHEPFIWQLSNKIRRSVLLHAARHFFSRASTVLHAKIHLLYADYFCSPQMPAGNGTANLAVLVPSILGMSAAGLTICYASLSARAGTLVS